ncbi:hypothetical protein HOE425_332516 [Hoeflea sp. EC-HK425]|nr:hypothetical protein HOE425_332516 [Hoeflea sp. EC-HK425]
MHRSQFRTVRKLESPDFGGFPHRGKCAIFLGLGWPVIPGKAILTASHERVIGLYGM